MLAGHYATALVAKSQNREMPLWLLLVLSQLTDILFIIFSIFGLEPVMAYDGPLGFIVEMTFSHDLVSILFQVAIVALIIHLICKNTRFTIWSAIIVAVHPLLDFISGYKHHVMGPHTLSYGLGNYASNPLAAFIIELVVTLLCLIFFLYANKRDGIKLSPLKYLIATSILVIPTLISILIVI